MHLLKRLISASQTKLAAAAIVGLLSVSNISAHSQALQQPATGYGNLLGSGAPSLTTFNSLVYLAYGASSGGQLNITFAYDGQRFNNPTQIAGVAVGSSPSLFTYNNSLYVYYRDSNDGTIKQVSSTDGVNFTAPVQLTFGNGGGPIYSSTPVSATNFNGSFWVAYTDSNGSVRTLRTDGTSIFSTYQTSYQYTTSMAPSILASSNQLVVGFIAGNHMLVMEGSPTGTYYNETTYPSIMMGSAPNLSLYNNARILVTFQSNDQYHILFQTSGYDPSTITSPATTYYNNIKIGGPPSCTQNLSSQSGSTLYCGFRSNDTYNWTFTAKGN